MTDVYFICSHCGDKRLASEIELTQDLLQAGHWRLAIVCRCNDCNEYTEIRN